MKMAVRSRIESRRAADFEFHSGDAQNIAKENALRPIVLARIDEDRQEHEESADDEEVNAAEQPERERADW